MSKQAYLMVRFSKDAREDYFAAQRRVTDTNQAAQRQIEDRRNARRKPLDDSPHLAEGKKVHRERVEVQTAMNHRGPISPERRAVLYEREQDLYQQGNRLGRLHNKHVLQANAERKPMPVSAAPKIVEELAWSKRKKAKAAYAAQLEHEGSKLPAPKPVHYEHKIKVPELDLSDLHRPGPSKKLLIGSAAIGGAVGGAEVYRRNRAKRRLEQ